MRTENRRCGCEQREEFDAQEAIRRLARDVQAISDLFHRYVSEAGLPNREDRVARALEYADRVARIVGGEPVQAGAFPDCALVGSATRFFCSGTLIHPRAVLSAGHCAPGRPTRVRLRCETDVSTGTEEEIPVTKVRVHPQYNTLGPWHDFSLLILAAPAKTKPAPRASTAELAKATSVQLVGFGYDDPDSPLGFGTKRQVNVAIAALKRKATDKLSAQANRLGFDADLEFVAGRKQLGKDTCNGDSGGPAYIRIGNTWKLAGTTSRATEDATHNCGDGGIYGRVDKHREWIDNILAGV
jgi:endonuclease G